MFSLRRKTWEEPDVDLRLSDEQRAVRETFAALMRKESTPQRVRIAESTGIDKALWQSYAQVEALGIGIPSDHGGADGGLLELALIAEEAGRRLAPIPIAETAAAARLLGRLGEKELLEPVLTGSNIVSLATGSRPVRDQLLVDGAIAHAVLAFDGESVLYVTRPDGQPTIPHRNLGGLPLARWDPDADATGRSLAEGEPARAEFARALDDVRVLRAAALTGLAGEAVQIGSEYAKVRMAFGQPIGMYQAVAHPFADILGALDGAQLLVQKACWALDSEHDDGPALASMAFVFAAETAYQASQHSLHVHGGYGFTEEYDIQLYYRRAKAWTVAFADPRRELLVLADRRFGPALPGGR
jgi:alkylation response protein AidB-like acyl-CoA dehydrogenase